MRLHKPIEKSVKLFVQRLLLACELHGDRSNIPIGDRL
jgi:hypothetical protein